MRVYKFLNEVYGRDDLCKKRLKISRLHELNDPFELAPYCLTDAGLRQAFLQTRDDLGECTGLTCFSSTFCNPVIWAHYSDCHRGLCLGFEIPDISGDSVDESAKVHYISKPLPFPQNFLALEEVTGLEIVRKILFTKYDHWQYENEIRRWASLEQEEDGHYFLSFGDDLRLVQVILGARSTLSRTDIQADLGSHESGVEITKVRAAYDSFEMVIDEGWE